MGSGKFTIAILFPGKEYMFQHNRDCGVDKHLQPLIFLGDKYFDLGGYYFTFPMITHFLININL